jgi:hypothetical protein
MNEIESRPHTSVYVALQAPDAPYADPDVHVSWSATRFSTGLETLTVVAHVNGLVTRIADSPTSLTLPEVPAWVPLPPANWLASFAEPDGAARMSAAIDAATTYHAPLAVFAEDGVL